MHHPTIVPITSLSEAEKAIQDIGSDPKSVSLMAPKMVSRVIRLHNVVAQDAIILKQDMLSIGGEVAVPKETFELCEKTASILIIGNVLQLRTLVQKLKRHYPRIRTIAVELEKFIEEIE
jgi:dihydropteroate synthase